MGWGGNSPGRGVALFGKMPRRTSAPCVPGLIFFFELCFGWGGPRGGSPVSGSTHACPGALPNMGPAAFLTKCRKKNLRDYFREKIVLAESRGPGATGTPPNRRLKFRESARLNLSRVSLFCFVTFPGCFRDRSLGVSLGKVVRSEIFFHLFAKKNRKVLQNDTLHRRCFRVQGPREHVQIDDLVFCDGMNMA